VDKHAADYYANSPTEDPVNTESGGDRVMRGGAAEFGNPDMFRCAFRHHSQPDGTYPAHGFRVARSQGH
jgi:formylglycine-generating enzyme required for sulfatase activity